MGQARSVCAPQCDGGRADDKHSNERHQNPFNTNDALVHDHQPSTSDAWAHRMPQSSSLDRCVLGKLQLWSPSTMTIGAQCNATLPRSHVFAQSVSTGSFRRYYPKEYYNQRVSNRYFRNNSLQIEFLGPMSNIYSSQTLSSTDSPSIKKPRSAIAEAHHMYDSLQQNIAPIAYADFNDEYCMNRTLVESPLIETSNEQTPKTQESMPFEDLDPTLSYRRAVSRNTGKSPIDEKLTSGPIKAAIMRNRLTAKVRAWLSMDGATSGTINGTYEQALSEQLEQTNNSAMTTPVKRPVSLMGTLRLKLKRQYNRRSWGYDAPTVLSTSIGTNTVKFDETLNRKRRNVTSTTPSVASSAASLNSLTGGRTPWPIPWLEAIFLPEYPNKSPINEKHFHVIGTIASGAFGKVHRVCLRDDKEKIFAMKVQPKSGIIARDAVQQIKHEISIHEAVSSCAFVASLYASWQSRSNLYIVLHYVCGFGDLYTLWRDVAPLPCPVVRIYAAECALAMEYLHASGIIYRDLKMENIVLDDKGHVQLVDFGLAKWLPMGERTNTICGTLQYMAPEIAAETPYEHSVDWWSLGVLIHVLASKLYPYPNAKDHYNLKYPPRKTRDLVAFNGHLNNLIDRLLDTNAQTRLCGIYDMSMHPFFDNFSIDAAAERRVHPFDYIPRMHRCDSCNVLHSTDLTQLSGTNKELEDKQSSYISKMFDEDYEEFDNFNYFNEKEFHG